MSRPKGSKNRKTLEREGATSTLKNIPQATSKKSPSDSSKNISLAAEKKSIPPLKHIERLPKCDLCNSPIPSSPRVLNLSQLTGFAPWHFEIQDRYKVCENCGKKFREIIEKGLIEMGAEKKEIYPG